MADEEHLAILREGVPTWNEWRKRNPSVLPRLRLMDLSGRSYCAADLSAADLSAADLSEANLRWTNLSRADLSGSNLAGASLRGATLGETNLRTADLRWVDLSGASMREADLREADLRWANLSRAYLGGANLLECDLSWANLFKSDLGGATVQGARLDGANLRQAKLRWANLSQSIFVRTCLEGTDLTGCRIFGISAWAATVDQHTIQAQLTITQEHEPAVTVDNLEVAQLVYLLLTNEKIRDVIDTVGKHAVLILGRFSEPRKRVLDVLREELRKRGYVPIVFDFERSTSRDFTETVLTLAGLCSFIIADITQPRSVPLELQATVPNYMIPLVPLIQAGEEPFAMFADLWHKHRDWVLDPLSYDDVSDLIDVFDKAIVERALRLGELLEARKAEVVMRRHTKEFT